MYDYYREVVFNFRNKENDEVVSIKNNDKVLIKMSGENFIRKSRVVDISNASLLVKNYADATPYDVILPFSLIESIEKEVE